MRLEKEQDLLRHLKEDVCLPVYLLYGQQSYLVRLYAKKLREKAVQFSAGLQDLTPKRNLSCQFYSIVRMPHDYFVFSCFPVKNTSMRKAAVFIQVADNASCAIILYITRSFRTEANIPSQCDHFPIQSA